MTRLVALGQVFALIVLIGFTNTANAQKEATGQPDLILSLAQSYGAARLTTDRWGDPLVDAAVNGVRYQIYFYECGETKAVCENIQFFAAWETEGRVSMASVNKWNQTRRFGTAHIDPENDAAIKMTANLEGGVSDRNLRSRFEYWIAVMNEFQQFIRDEGCC